MNKRCKARACRCARRRASKSACRKTPRRRCSATRVALFATPNAESTASTGSASRAGGGGALATRRRRTSATPCAHGEGGATPAGDAAAEGSCAAVAERKRSDDARASTRAAGATRAAGDGACMPRSSGAAGERGGQCRARRSVAPLTHSGAYRHGRGGRRARAVMPRQQPRHHLARTTRAAQQRALSTPLCPSAVQRRLDSQRALLSLPRAARSSSATCSCVPRSSQPLRAPGALARVRRRGLLSAAVAMSRHLDRLFTQAFTGEEAKAAPAPRRPAPAPGPEAEEDEAADPAEPSRIIAAHKRRDYAACLGLEPVTLDALGRPQWDVTDRRAPAARGRCRSRAVRAGRTLARCAPGVCPAAVR